MMDIQELRATTFRYRYPQDRRKAHDWLPGRRGGVMMDGAGFIQVATLGTGYMKHLIPFMFADFIGRCEHFHFPALWKAGGGAGDENYHLIGVAKRGPVAAGIRSHFQ